MRSEGFYVNEKIPMTPSGIEPATFRFVAQRYRGVTVGILFFVWPVVTFMYDSGTSHFLTVH